MIITNWGNVIRKWALLQLLQSGAIITKSGSIIALLASAKPIQKCKNYKLVNVYVKKQNLSRLNFTFLVI